MPAKQLRYDLSASFRAQMGKRGLPLQVSQETKRSKPWRAQSKWTRERPSAAGSCSAAATPSQVAGVNADDSVTFRRWLTSQYANGSLSAKQVCGAAWSLGSVAEAAGVADLARHPDAQSGSFASFLEARLGLANQLKQSLYWAKIPQSTKTSGRALLPHPFLLPHLQVDASCYATDAEFLSLPYVSQLSVMKERGPLCLGRLYVDGVDPGGKARKSSQKVYVFSWTPLGTSSRLRRIITVVLGARCCKACGCGGRCTRNAVWRICCWSWAALRAGKHPTAGPDLKILSGSLAVLAGKSLNCRGQVAHMGADWEVLVGKGS